MLSLPQRLRLDSEQWKLLARQLSCDIRVACPGIVQSFDADKQTVEVKLAIRENVLLTQIEGGAVASVPTPVEVPLLVDVPIVLPRAGGYLLTMPVRAGDECLVVFGDSCMDSWWQSGGVQNQMDRRRHDLSDGFAILGCWSQPNKVAGYATDGAELRNEDGTVSVKLKNGDITVKAPTVAVQAGTVNVSGSDQVNISGGNCQIDGKNFLQHKHSGVQTGSGSSGVVL